MLHLRICVMIFMVLIGTILSENQHAKSYHYHDISRAHTSWTGRFDFYYFDELRKQFCHSFCKPADIDYMSYIAKLMCAAKCPELYLPHSTSTSSTESTTTKITTTTINTTTESQQNQSIAPSNTNVPQTPQQNQPAAPSNTSVPQTPQQNQPAAPSNTSVPQTPQQNQPVIPSAPTNAG